MADNNLTFNIFGAPSRMTFESVTYQPIGDLYLELLFVRQMIMLN